ncbi:o-succinylbenzoate--CoA ligase [Mycolicibacterium rhodesiae JS60]|nr:o-succinylbenzoate--CoA ligase [Mycolicibacterium rhodesiae JS60]
MDLETPLPRLIRAAAEHDPSAVFVEEAGTDVTQTYGQFDAAVMQWADAFHVIGARAESFVATMLPTSLASYYAWLGLAWLRAVEVPINPEFVGQTMIYPLNNSKAETLVIAAEYVDRLAAISTSLNHLKTVVVVNASESLPDLPWRVVSVEQFLAEGRPAPYAVPRYDDSHAVIYTSGTTGPSKGVLQPWVNLHGMAQGIFPDEQPGETSGGAVYTCWPTFHSSGKFGMCIAPLFGLRMVFRPKFSLSHFWSDVRRHGVTHAPLLVVSGLLMAQPPLPDDLDNPLLKVGMYPLIPEFEEFGRRFGVRVSAGYGTTESGWAVTTVSPANHRTNGRPSPGYQIRIVNEHGESLPPNEVGEIVVRHELPWRLNKGYLGMPEATAEAWRDGWFHTGDAGRFDDDGNFYFVDRLKDSLRCRGHNVSSFEVEAEVLAHPQVAECACVGVPSGIASDDDAVKDDDIKIFVITTPSASLTAPELIEFLRPRMAKFMLPRYVEFIDKFPTTSNGKVRKAELRQRPVGNCWDRGDERTQR